MGKKASYYLNMLYLAMARIDEIKSHIDWLKDLF